MQRLKSALKILPKPLRVFLGWFKHYFQRLFRWGVILAQIRGETLLDKIKIISSALVSPLSSFKNLSSWQDPFLLFDTRVVVKGVGRFYCRRFCDDLWHVLPWREKEIFRAITSRLQLGDVFIDAGANIGVYTVFASKLVGATGRVICVEMMPDTADRLENHIRLNNLQNVTIVRKAISDTAGKTVTAVVEAGKYGQASIAKDHSCAKSVKRINVATTTLDDICCRITEVRLMKMDLEGVELPALVGAKTLLQHIECLIYESWGNTRAALNPVNAYLIDAGFEIVPLDGNNLLAQRNRL